MPVAPTPGPAWRLVRELLIALFTPLYLLVVVLPFALITLVLSGFSNIRLSLASHALSRRMRALNRTTTWAAVESHLDSSDGTLIIDDQSLGWNFAHVWWVPGPADFDAPYHDWPADPRASLVDTIASARARARLNASLTALQARHPSLTVRRSLPPHLAGPLTEAVYGAGLL